jgi:hypothetical protein
VVQQASPGSALPCAPATGRTKEHDAAIANTVLQDAARTFSMVVVPFATREEVAEAFQRLLEQRGWRVHAWGSDIFLGFRPQVCEIQQLAFSDPGKFASENGPLKCRITGPTDRHSTFGGISAPVRRSYCRW